MLENMQEMVKNLALITRDLARGREFDKYRNQYGLKPYWNPQRRPMNNDIRKNPSNQAPSQLSGLESKSRRILIIILMKRMKKRIHQRRLISLMTLMKLLVEIFLISRMIFKMIPLVRAIFLF